MTDLTTGTILKRGLAGLCPRCGKGKLLRAYITPNKSCNACGLDFEPLRADDGPAWATILITGHISMPFAFWLLDAQSQLSTFTQTAILIGFVLALSAAILPRAKGAFMAIIWMSKKKEPEPEDS